MNRTKRVLLIVALSIAGLFLLGNLLAYIYKDKVRNIVVNTINQNLKSKVEVKEISFSFLRNFPYATIDFIQVKANESREFTTTGNVLNAGEVSLLFNLSSIFNEEYRLKKIVITDATFNLQIDKNGNSNYEIWKNSGDSSSVQAFKLELQDVKFENVDVLYYNVSKQQDLNFKIDEGSLQGNFSQNNYNLVSSGSLSEATVLIDDVKYLSKTNCELQLSLDVDQQKGLYTFNNSTIKLSGLTLSLKGKISDQGEFLDVDLDVISPDANLPALLSVIPDKYKADTKGYNYSGNIEFNGTVKGRTDKTHSPLIAFSFKSKDVSLNPKGTPYHLKNMNCNGYFTNRKNNSNPVTYLKLQNFKARLEGKPVNAEIEIENFNKPRLNIVASMEADLNAISKFFKPDTLEEISGVVKIDASFNGIAGDKTTYKSTGDIAVSNVNFKLKQKPARFKINNGLFHLDGNDLVVENLTGTTGNSDFSLSGNFQNLFAWLFMDNQSLNITANFSSNAIDLDELMAKDNTSSGSADTIYRLEFSQKLKFSVDANIKLLKFKKFVANEVTGTIAMNEKVLTTREINFKTVDGDVVLKGMIDNRLDQNLRIEYDAIIKNLDINKLFYEMGNFGQTVIIDKNLKGRVSAVVKFKSKWTDKLVLDENSIYAKSDITIENGELLNFEPMLALSRFLKGADLKSIKFSTLTNTIEIKNRSIHIPMMEIKSSALDLTATGVHTFDNVVDYKLRLYLSQIMGRKVRAQNTEFGTIEDDGLGRPMIFLSMKGSASNPKFTWDRNSTEKKITDEVKNETKSFKNIIKQEFSNQKSDPAKTNTPKKKEELQIDFEEDAPQ